MADAATPRRDRQRGGPGFLIFALAGVAMLVGLGTWQLDRRQWKESLIADREAAFSRPPLHLSGAADEADAAAWRRVTVTGIFLHDRETLVGPRAREGVPGWHVVAPLRLAGGRIVFVDRGWIPVDLKDPIRRTGARPEGLVTVEGVVKRPAPPGRFTLENRPSSGQWLHVAPAALAAHWKLSDVAPWWVEKIARSGDRTYPLGTAGLALPSNNHLQYAITWYSLAAALAIIAVIRARALRRADDV